MKYLIGFIFMVGLLTSCSHVRQTCDSYCFSRGGQCDRVSPGMTRYNTVTGATEERPTEFFCRYNW